MDNCRAVLPVGDYLVLLAALRNRVRDRRRAFDRSSVAAEIMRFFDLVEFGMPKEVPFETAFYVARSNLMLGRPTCALNRIEIMLIGEACKSGRSCRM